MKLTNEAVKEYFNNYNGRFKTMADTKGLDINSSQGLINIMGCASYISRFDGDEQHKRMYIGALDLFLDKYITGKLFSYIDSKLINNGLMNRISDIDYFSDEPERFIHMDSIEDIEYYLDKYKGINVDFNYLIKVYKPLEILSIIENKKEYLTQFINSECFSTVMNRELQYKTVLQFLYDKKISVEDIPIHLL